MLHSLIINNLVSVSWTHFARITSRSALLPDAVLSPHPVTVPVTPLSLMGEGFRLRVGERRSLRALVERGRGTGWRLQKPADGWMV